MEKKKFNKLISTLKSFDSGKSKTSTSNQTQDARNTLSQGGNSNVLSLIDIINSRQSTPNQAPMADRSGTSAGFTGADGSIVPYRNEEQATVGGVYGQDRADDLAADQSRFVEKPISGQQANAFVLARGLQGMMSPDELAGLTPTQARLKADRFRKERQDSVSANTSYSFDPKSLAGVRDSFKELKFRVNENNNYAWNDADSKKEKNDLELGSFAEDIAKNFKDAQQFQLAQQDKNFNKMLEEYEQMGGDRIDVEAKIGQVTPTTQSAVSSLEEYLGNVDSPEAKSALELLAPQLKITQDEIAFEQNLPERYREFYFGDEDTIGFLEKKEKQAEEAIKLIEREAKQEKDNAKALANLEIQKAELSLQRAEASVEKNRLQTKNYLVGQLAKLGALKTTGAAPEAVANLEQKYQQQATELRQDFEYGKREMEINLKNQIKSIDLGRDSDILKVRENLTNSEEDVWKKVFDLQNAADRKTFDLVSNFAGKFTTESEKFRKELEKKAKEYETTLVTTIGDYDPRDMESSLYGKFVADLIQAQDPNTPAMSTVENKSYIPDFLQQVMKSNSISSMSKNVLSGKKDIGDYKTAKNQSIIQSEIQGLGLPRNVIDDYISSGGGETKELSTDERKREATVYLETIAPDLTDKNKQELKRQFLKEYPSDGALFNSWFNED